MEKARTTKGKRQELPVVGKGRLKDGRVVYAVASRSQANRWHLVIVNRARLSCDCLASRYGRVCSHRRAVHARLVAERDAVVLRRLLESIGGE
jgi:hypothetical protein